MNSLVNGKREWFYELQVGVRYLRARVPRDDGLHLLHRRRGMLGIALGVAALIVVLSVMNGSSGGARDACSVIALVQVAEANGRALPDLARATARALSSSAPAGGDGGRPSSPQALLGRGDQTVQPT